MARTKSRRGAGANGIAFSGLTGKIAEWSLFSKFFYGIIAIVITVLCFSSVTSYLYSRQIFERQAAETATRLVNNINTGFEDNLDQVDRMIMSIYLEAEDDDSKTSMKEALSPEPYANVTEQYEAQLVVQRFYERLLYLRKDFNGIYIYVSPEKQFSYAAYGTAKWGYDPTVESWYAKTVAAGGRTVISPPHEPFQLTYDKQVISFSRVLKGIVQDNINVPDGVILIDLSIDVLTDIVEKADIRPPTGILLLDETGETVYSHALDLPRGRLDDAIIERMSRQASGSFTAEVNGIRYLLSYSTIEVTGWKSLTLTPYSELNKAGNRLLLIHLLIGLIAILLTILIAYLLANRIFKPIFELKKGMARVKQGHFDVALQPSSGDELGQLVLSFNSMTNTIKSLIVEKYEEEIARKNAEFNYLQSQINPHFIYNTLQIVSGMAALHKVPDIGTVSKNLAKMLRYGINLQQRTVPIRDEIDNVTCYMDIQKLRFRGFFDFDLDVDEDIYSCYTIKLILQPLVENAIAHGLEAKGEGGRVRVSGKRSGQEVVFEIYDNGAGMTEEEVVALMASIRSPEQAERGGSPKPDSAKGSHNFVGLRNIHQRIQTMFGEPYGLSIDSSKNEWTRVIIRIPVRTTSEG
ncbi:cache domain-containing sensor histidine kinase [Cohnella massiliensis]|uniref:cache domain-containing sensor histidine kinase n=1 Tax=Cohnella massiliensis TaxID=1816691 RepID=UPI0009BAA364|nr:sensor histidine kinase [Cohnella massiliensis]